MTYSPTWNYISEGLNGTGGNGNSGSCNTGPINSDGLVWSNYTKPSNSSGPLIVYDSTNNRDLLYYITVNTTGPLAIPTGICNVTIANGSDKSVISSTNYDYSDGNTPGKPGYWLSSYKFVNESSVAVCGEYIVVLSTYSTLGAANGGGDEEKDFYVGHVVLNLDGTLVDAGSTMILQSGTIGSNIHYPYVIAGYTMNDETPNDYRQANVILQGYMIGPSLISSEIYVAFSFYGKEVLDPEGTTMYGSDIRAYKFDGSSFTITGTPFTYTNSTEASSGHKYFTSSYWCSDSSSFYVKGVSSGAVNIFSIDDNSINWSYAVTNLLYNQIGTVANKVIWSGYTASTSGEIRIIDSSLGTLTKTISGMSKMPYFICYPLLKDGTWHNVTVYRNDATLTSMCATDLLDGSINWSTSVTDTSTCAIPTACSNFNIYTYNEGEFTKAGKLIASGYSRDVVSVGYKNIYIYGDATGLTRAQTEVITQPTKPDTPALFNVPTWPTWEWPMPQYPPYPEPWPDITEFDNMEDLHPDEDVLIWIPIEESKYES